MREKITRLCFVALFNLAACAQVPASPLPLSEQSPQLLYTIPDTSQKISVTPQIALIFSKPIDPGTINDTSILFLSGSIDINSYNKSSDLYKAIDKGSLPVVSLNFTLKEGGQVLLISPDEELSPENTYTLMVTPRVLSPDRVPINQNTESGMTPVLSFYQTGKKSFVQEANPAGALPASPRSGSPSMPNVPTAIQPSTPAPALPAPSLGTVVLNEIYYDAVGSDTDGVLFVELYGTPGKLIEGDKINFVNGSDGNIDDSITLPSGAKIRSDGFFLIADAKTSSPTSSNITGADLIDNFDPQNGPDAVQLLDAAGKLLDAVSYGVGGVALAQNGLAIVEGSPAPDVINGHSIERKTPGLDTNDNLNDFVDRETPTPGK